MSGVSEAVADAIEPGLTERDGSTTVARVTHVDVRPSVITATATGGSASVVEHPFLREVTITAQLRIRETTSGVRFKGETIRQGSTVVLDLGTILVEADVGTIGT